MRADTYAHIQPSTKHKVLRLDDCVDVIRHKHPAAYMEGSAGLQRMFVVWVGGRRLMAGHAWSRINKFWWVRVFDIPIEW